MSSTTHSSNGTSTTSAEKENVLESKHSTHTPKSTEQNGSGEKRNAAVVHEGVCTYDLNSLKRNRPNETPNSETIFDGAYVYGLNAGDRVHVKWDIIENEHTDNERTVEHWWGATLLEFDGRTLNSDEDDDNDNPTNESNTNDDGPVAIHVLEYDAYPEGGFPEKSREDVIFVSAFELVDLTSQDVMEYKRDGDDGMISLGDNNANNNCFEEVVNSVLKNAMNKSFGANFDKLPTATQLQIAEKIATKKTKLVQLMDDFFRTSGKRIGTSKDMKELIERTMQD